jgi:hypothetical protein
MFIVTLWHHAWSKLASSKEGKRAGLAIVDTVRQTAARGEDARELDEFRREINGADAAAAHRSEIAGRTAYAPAEIEDVHAGVKASPCSMLLGRQDTEAMKLVERMEVPKSGFLRIDVCVSEPGLDPLQQVGTAVIALTVRLRSRSRAAEQRRLVSLNDQNAAISNRPRLAIGGGRSRPP